MSSEKKKTASRKNGSKGHGPNSQRGMAHAKMNAVKFGIYAKSELLRGEDPKEYEAVRKQMFDEINPIGIVQGVVVDRMVHIVWNILRLKKLQRAVLKRTEIVLALTEVAKQAGELFVPLDEVDRAFRDALWRDEIGRSPRGAVANGAVATAETVSASASVVADLPAIPATYTLFHNLGPGEIGEVNAAVERQLEKAVKSLLNLYRKLEELRSRRQTYTVPVVEAEQSQTPRPES